MSASLLRDRLVALALARPPIRRAAEILSGSPESVRGAPISINRQLFQLAWPSLVENLLQTMLGVVDLIFVGQLGADAIAGIGLGNQIMFTLMVGFIGLSVGNQALVARAIGARDSVDAQRIAKQSLIIAALISVVLAFLGQLYGEKAIAFLGATPEVTALGGAFVRITSIFAVFMGIMLVGGGTLRGAGDTRTPMLITGSINFINIFLDYGLIFGNLGFPRVGAIGSAYATTIARGVGSLLILYVLFKRGSRIMLSQAGTLDRARSTPAIIRLDWKRGWRLRGATVRRILNIGWPSAAENVLFQLGFLAFSALVVGLGTADLAAMQIGFNIQGFSMLPAFAFGVAALTLVGQSLGANDIRRAELTAKQALKTGSLWMSLMGLAFFIWRRELFGFYTEDESVLALGGTVMLFIGLMQPLLSVAVILGNVLRGAGDTRATMIITGFSVWVVRVGVGYLLGIVLGLGLLGIYIGWCADFVTRSTLVTLRYRAGRWKKLKV